MIRFRNTRTGKQVEATSGKDVANMVKIEQDRRSGLEATTAQSFSAHEKRELRRDAEFVAAMEKRVPLRSPSEREADMAEQARGELRARLSA